MQRAAWRTATVAISPPGVPVLNDQLNYPHAISISNEYFAALYPLDALPDLAPWPWLDACARYHRDTIANASMLGYDFGNVGSVPMAGVYGMNRLNHDPAIFREYWRSGDARLRDVAVRWCENFYDLSIWWGEDREGEFGGTRYNNRAAMGKDIKQDPAYMWRSDSAVHFCTKGYDSFLYAYEETGDPRMAAALRWQTEYAARMIHTDRGECRNIGDAADFMRLYEATGQVKFRDEAMRLFRELRTKLMPDHRFSQGGQPIVPDDAFIDDDDAGYKHPFAKPYIIGYALSGLPMLARYTPDEPRLNEVIRSVADFLASSVDPVGGWRYPHPLSSSVIIGQGMEHAMQIARAAEWLEMRGEKIENLLDAVEKVLQARVLGFQRSGAYLGGLNGWERSTNALKDGETLYDRYKKPTDRDRTRDYTEGGIGTGGNSPDGAVYFFEVLAFYLQHRPAERLLNATPELRTVLDRIAPAPATAKAEYTPYGVKDLLPAFAAQRVARMGFPLAYDLGEGVRLREGERPREPETPRTPRLAGTRALPLSSEWRARARAALLESFQTPPPRADFDPAVIATEDRGTYEARKIALNISADARVPAYLLVPQGKGPFPGIVALHDHGAHFSIGKEKVIKPFGVAPEVASDAQDWVNKYYGGQFIGDELAKRGFVVLGIDALFWGERGEEGGSEYKHQEALAANLLQLGMSFSGVIAWDDIRSTEFLAGRSEVDPARIGCLGLSMGSHRAWTLCAATDLVRCGAAICWLGDTPTLMSPGNNQTKGQSAFSMLAPGLRNALDYPDVASIACPKPMLFFNGDQDPLFPVPGVEAAFAKLHAVWKNQGAEEKLLTKLWPAPHEFNAAMQEAALAFLDTHLR